MPRSRRVRTEREVREAAEAIGLPLILKPIAGAGSADTYAVRTPAELNAALHATRGVPEASCEEYVDGEEFTFDTVYIAAGHSTSHIELAPRGARAGSPCGAVSLRLETRCYRVRKAIDEDLQRAAIADRISAARERVEAAGGRWGRLRRLDCSQVARVLALRRAGQSLR